MSFARYPEYRDSGVEWLGKVPAHWDARRLKFLFTLQKRAPREDDGIVTAFRDGEVTLRSNRRTEGFTNAIHEIGYQGIRRGDLVIHAMDAFAGAIGVSDSDGKSTPVYSVCIPTNGNINAWYYGRLLRNMALSGYINSLAKGVRERSTEFRWADASEVILPVPGVAEQHAIATFLDHETAKIDTLVAEQEKLIALLKEKRQAVISHAVTKGLDPSVPMKDSGVEWLGEVPGHWVVCKLRHVIAAIEQGWSPECHAREAEDKEWGVLKAGCVNGGVFRPSENKALPPELSPEETYEVRIGDVLMSRASGSPDLVGSTALVNVTRERLMLSDKIFRLKLENSVNPSFFVAALNSRPLRIQIENALSGGNGMANNLPQSSLLSFALTVPPVAEQGRIISFLDHETAALDKLTIEAQSAITLLQERRAALISAAVTGQIDVRGFAPAKAA